MQSMRFLTSLFKRKTQPLKSYADFWKWFVQNEQKFYNVVKDQGAIKKVFFSKLEPKLKELKDGFWFLVGMSDTDEAELILTAEGVIPNIVFVEELVAAAPKMAHWKITALKQASTIDALGIEMDGYTFNAEKMRFYATTHDAMPDEIDITITHEDFNATNSVSIINGVYIALDILIGELNVATKIDQLDVIHPKEATTELIPLEKLKDFLIWREKEFVEKYKGLRRDTEKDTYSSLEGTLQNGLPLIAIINSDLLNWDSKASHPWIAVVEIKYDGKKNNGMPSATTYQRLNAIEDQIMTALQATDGHLNIGRETADSVRKIYLANKDFRKVSKVLYHIKIEHSDSALDFNIYKDKYWQSFQHFMPH